MLLDALSGQPALKARVLAAVRVGERRWNLRMKNGADILLPEGNEAVALAKLMDLQSTQALLDRPADRGRHAPPRPPGGASATRRHARGATGGEEGVNDMSRRAVPPTAPDDVPARVRASRAGPFGVLDIGSTKIICLIGRVEGDGRLRVLGMGWQRARGVRGGGITDLDEAERAIRGAVAQAEDMSDHRLRSVTVNLTCGQPESRLFNVQWPVGGRARDGGRHPARGAGRPLPAPSRRGARPSTRCR